MKVSKIEIIGISKETLVLQGEGVAAEVSFKIYISNYFPEFLIFKYETDESYYGIQVDEIAQTILRKSLEIPKED